MVDFPEANDDVGKRGPTPRILDSSFSTSTIWKFRDSGSENIRIWKTRIWNAWRFRNCEIWEFRILKVYVKFENKRQGALHPTIVFIQRKSNVAPECTYIETVQRIDHRNKETKKIFHTDFRSITFKSCIQWKHQRLRSISEVQFFDPPNLVRRTSALITTTKTMYEIGF